MKTNAFVFSLLSFLMFAFIQPASAQSTPHATKTQVKQQKRIAQGVRSGELTRAEVRQVQSQQRRVQLTKKRAKADGIVTVQERAVIHSRQKKASRNLVRQKHDRQDRNR